MAIVNRHIDTKYPNYGLGPQVLNVVQQYIASAKASGGSALYSTANYLTATNNTINASVAPGTAVDYPRNALVLLSPNTASSSLYSAGTVVLYGKDIKGVTQSESFAATALNTVSSPTEGSVVFAQVDTISFSGFQFHTGSSSARSAVSVSVGVGARIGLPVSLKSSDAVVYAYIGTARQLTSAGTDSTNNQYTVYTGDYSVAAVKFSNALATGTPVQVLFNNLGFNAPVHA
jgi:hypothetical protein